MKRFDSKGMLIIPNPARAEAHTESEKSLVVKECFCQNGHNLVSSRAVFNGYHGIILKVSRHNKEGLVALCPVYGYKSRVSLDVDLGDTEVWTLKCPHCDALFPVYMKCDCGGDLVCLFLDDRADHRNCICICNRIGCYNAGIIYSNEMITVNIR